MVIMEYFVSIIVGVTDWEAHTNIHVGPKAQSKEEPLLDHGKNPP